MDFSDLQNQVKILLGDTSNKYFTVQEVKDQCNRVMPQIAAETEELLTFCDYTLVDGTQRYALKADFQTVKQVELHIDTSRIEKLIFLNMEQFHTKSYAQADQKAEPRYYKIEFGAVSADGSSATPPPGDMWLYPTPDTAWTLRVYYYQRPTILSSDTDVPEFNEHMHMAIAYKAAQMLALKNQDVQKAGVFQSLYNDAVRISAENLNRLQRDRAYFAKDEMGYTIDEDLDSFPDT